MCCSCRYENHRTSNQSRIHLLFFTMFSITTIYHFIYVWQMFNHCSDCLQILHILLFKLGKCKQSYMLLQNKGTFYFPLKNRLINRSNFLMTNSCRVTKPNLKFLFGKYCESNVAGEGWLHVVGVRRCATAQLWGFMCLDDAGTAGHGGVDRECWGHCGGGWQ